MNVANNLFAYTDEMCTKLQGKQEDVFTAFQLIDGVCKKVRVLTNVDGMEYEDLVKSIMEPAITMYKKIHGVDPIHPRKNQAAGQKDGSYVHSPVNSSYFFLL